MNKILIIQDGQAINVLLNPVSERREYEEVVGFSSGSGSSV